MKCSRKWSAHFEFHLAGEAQVDGHACWVLDAEPKPGYEPTIMRAGFSKG
jgi:hypothetical protein